MTNGRESVHGSQKMLRVVTPEISVRTGLANKITANKLRRKWAKTEKRYMLRLLKYIVFTAIVFYLLGKIKL